MNWSLSWLMTPSRSSTMSRAARVGMTASDANWTMAVVGVSVGVRATFDVGASQAASFEMSATRFIVAATPIQQREPIGADRRVVGHHHDVVEEAVDDRLGGRKRLQRARVIAACAVPIDLGRKRIERLPEIAFRARGEALDVDANGRLAAALLQDVDDALVGGRQRIGFRKRLEGLHRSQLIGNEVDALRPLDEHCFDLVRRVALLAQMTAQAIVEEIGERFGHGLRARRRR